jgi:Ca2+-binding RTX toxin-like protein
VLAAAGRIDVRKKLISGEYVGTSGNDVLVDQPGPATSAQWISNFAPDSEFSGSINPIFVNNGTAVQFETLNMLHVKNLLTGEITSTPTPGVGLQNSYPTYPAFSSDGSKKLTVTDDGSIFVEDVATGEVKLVSSDRNGVSGDFFSAYPVFTPDGTKVVFWSFASNLVANDPNGNNGDLFIKDLVSGEVTRLRMDEDSYFGRATVAGISMSPDGTKIVVHTNSAILDQADGEFDSDVYVIDITKPLIGSDTFYGGDGEDTVSYRRATIGVTVDLGEASGRNNTGDAAGDRYVSIERFDLSQHNDIFIGNSVAGSINVAYGLNGDDLFEGFGADTQNTFHGGAGGDVFLTRDSVTVAYGGEGNDLFLDEGSTQGSNTFHGGAGADQFFSGGGNDKAYGDAGNDTLVGGDGDDLLSGGADEDELDGGLGNDTLNGGTGIDRLQGGGGNDKLNGGEGDDLITGGSGDDFMRGGEGADLFVFNAGETGSDVIADFVLGVDQLQFPTYGIGELTFRELRSGTLVTYEPTGATVLLKGVFDWPEDLNVLG